MRNLAILVLILVGALVVFQFGSKFIPAFSNPQNGSLPTVNEKLVREQSVVIDVVKKVGPSVVTIGVESRGQSNLNSPFSVFFNVPQTTPSEGQQQEDYIGSGFIVSRDGLIVSNKHVVADSSQKYLVIDSKGKKYSIANIYRDPLNDIAILKISNPPRDLTPVEFGDSDKLEVGQFAIAIGTALGEFRNTVTTGVISGLGRGISAGSVFEGFVERLDNVIQTDAAINPGNSGGPLLNIEGQVIGVNSAVAQSGQNIGFSIPINIIRDSIENFNKTGQFNRPFLGVSYILISRQAALLNDLPEGALVREVVPGSSADSAGVKADDVITKIDGKKITDANSLAAAIASKKVGDSITISIYREGKTQDLATKLTASTP